MSSRLPLSVTAFAETGANLLGVAIDGTLALWRDDQLSLTTSAARVDSGAAALRGPDLDLRITLTQEPSAAASSGAREHASRVNGALRSATEQLTIDAPGTELTLPLPDARFDSLRIAVAWLGAERSLTLTAVRPARVRGHDRDQITAWAREEGRVALVADPRLSITELTNGPPLRIGLELWIESEDGETEYPRRASGEVSGGGVELSGQRLHIRAEPVHWRSREGDGPGLLLVGRPA